jgi:hypothetical protein
VNKDITCEVDSSEKSGYSIDRDLADIASKNMPQQIWDVSAIGQLVLPTENFHP